MEQLDRKLIRPVWEHDCEACTHIHTLMSPEGRYADFYQCRGKDPYDGIGPSWVIRLSNEPSDNITPGDFVSMAKYAVEFMEDEVCSKWENDEYADPIYFQHKKY